jgi:hypothetical protein
MTNKCARMKCEWSTMLKECLVYSSMHLGVPFIAPRQLGVVDSISRRQFLPSVAWRTVQSGAPPDTVRCGFLSFFGEADRWRFGAVDAPDTVRCPFWPLALATRRARITRPTVGPADCWLTGQSGAPPDSPVIYSHTPLIASREQPVDSRRPGAPDTVRCTTGQSGASRPSCLWLNNAIFIPTWFLMFPSLRHNTLVTKTMY